MNQDQRRQMQIEKTNTLMERIKQRQAERNAAFQAEMQKLEEGGADYAGTEDWQQIMRNLGRM
jgi:hypothetical protein